MRYSKQSIKTKSNRIVKKIKRYLYYEKKITPKLDIKNDDAIDLFFKDQGITTTINKRKYLVHLNELKTNEVLLRRSIRKPRSEEGSRRKQYTNYLHSEEWQLKREEVFSLRGRKCERCNKDLTNKIADVHHKTYDRLFNELMEDLEVLCRPCHQEEHKDKRNGLDAKKVSPVKKKNLSMSQKIKMLETEKGREKLKEMGYNFTKKVAI